MTRGADRWANTPTCTARWWPVSGIKTHSKRRKLRFHPDEVRTKIQAHKLVETLQDFIFGTIDRTGKKRADLSMAQVRAIDVLLKKCVPDLTRTLISADLNVRYVAELPPVLTRAEWLAKYGPKQIEGTVNVDGNGNPTEPTGLPPKILQ
jgi:hypothetical protein